MLTFSIKEHGRLECAAAALTLLAYPDLGSDNFSDDRYDEVCSYLLWAKAVADLEWAHQHQKLRPALFLRPHRAAEVIGRKLQSRLTKAVRAGVAAITLLKRPDTSVNAVMELAAERVHVDPTNLRHRTWIPYLPVVHLCAAFAATLHNSAQEGVPPDPALLMMEDDQKVLHLSKLAQSYEEPVAAHPTIAITSTEQTLLRISS